MADETRLVALEGRRRHKPPLDELLERERELSVIRAALADAAQAVGSVVLVEAPAGVGKSRLLAAGRGCARDANVHVLSARGGELERAFPFGVVRHLLEPVLRDADRDGRAALFRGAAALAAPALGLVEADEPARVEASFATAHGLYWLTAELASRRPLALAPSVQ